MLASFFGVLIVIVKKRRPFTKRIKRKFKQLFKAKREDKNPPASFKQMASGVEVLDEEEFKKRKHPHKRKSTRFSLLKKNRKSKKNRDIDNVNVTHKVLYGSADIQEMGKKSAEHPMRLSQKKKKAFKEKQKRQQSKKEKARKTRASQNVGGASNFSRKLNKWLFNLYLVDTLYDPQLKLSNPFSDSSRQEGKIRSVKAWLPYVFNASILYIIAYIVAYMVYQFSVIVAAGGYTIDAVLFYFEVMFPMGNASVKWTPESIIAITLAGPLVSLLLAALWYYVIIVKKRPITQLVKLFFIWLIFHSFNMFFGAWVAGVVTDQGFGYVANWMYFSTAAKFFVALLCLFVIATIGWKSTYVFLQTANSNSRLRKNNRSFFILYQGVLPWLFGTLLMLFIKIPNVVPQHENIIVYDAILLCSMLFFVLPMFFNVKVKPTIKKATSSRKKLGFNFLYMGIAILLILLYRFGLSSGILFEISWSLKVSPW